MSEFTGLTVCCAQKLKAGSWRQRIGEVGIRSIIQAQLPFKNAYYMIADHETGVFGFGGADSAKPDQQIQWMQFPAMKTWDEGTARNDFITAVPTSHVLFVNSDCVLTQEAIRWVIEQFEKTPNQAINAQRRELSLPVTEFLVSSCFGGALPPEDKLLQFCRWSLPRNWYMGGGDFQAFPVKFFKEVGGYDETMTGYGGHDFDLHDRLLCWGLKNGMTKEPPYLHLYHGTAMQRSPHHEQHEQRLLAYAKTGDENILRVNPHRLLEWGVANESALPEEEEGRGSAAESVPTAI